MILYTGCLHKRGNILKNWNVCLKKNACIVKIINTRLMITTNLASGYRRFVIKRNWNKRDFFSKDTFNPVPFLLCIWFCFILEITDLAYVCCSAWEQFEVEMRYLCLDVYSWYGINTLIIKNIWSELIVLIKTLFLGNQDKPCDKD